MAEFEQIIPKVSQDLRDVVRIGLVRAEPVTIRPADPEFERKAASLSAALRSAHAGKAPSQISGVQAARELYRAFGIDPTRTRPSSEALLRRILRGESFPHINNAVDVCNLVGLRSLLPPGLYDADAIDGAVTLRRGDIGESYEGIRKADVNLEGRPTLADETGPFGNPTSDSLRTSVKSSTRSVWLVLFAPMSFEVETLRQEIARVADDLSQYLKPAADRVETITTLLP